MEEDIMLKNTIYEQILQMIDIGIHVIDTNGKTIIYNEKMKKIEGMEVQDVLDKNLLDVFSFHQNEDSTLLAALKYGKTIKNVKQTYFNNKGHMITTINDTFPIIDNGTKVGAIEVARDVTKLERLIRENMDRKGAAKYTFDSIIGKSKELMEVIESSKRATRTSSSVLIIGDTGTGKELFAQSIHNGSSRSSKPFISQNCAALPDTLIEGLLFGTKKGAFTGAIERAGLFEQAEGGTLLLDELNSLSPALQAKLLRVIQERSVRRIGDTKDRDIDVRIIATINEDPIDAIANGRLRKDLYYRLSVVSLFIPPLKERKKDIKDLVYYFIEKYSQLFGMTITGVEKEVLDAFLLYNWPGNVRELEHVIEGTLNLLDYEEKITFSHLPIHFRNKSPLQPEVPYSPAPSLPSNQPIKSLEDYMEDAEKFYLLKVLEHHQNNITKAAKALNMSRQNLQYRVRKHGLRKA
ncbi:MULTISPECIES: sigma-54-dependent Fis family transcriptional regulator [unclassified Bacillus (in: firmicutes)]|uniref:sigma-54 interaction domain-containing protein n=1 Tax=unclassified Bacillus (in: firmicutes) TaxID=185979 RepID=UPI0008F2FE5E|nr:MULTISPECIES: sigma 54-interacting transcriptional regulator [unclassified Bacillus (in: firmicutes)]SFB13115.1 arginine utilization regulatory protein [Bacillus sp. UNCCL13]SFQ90099.1 arginine utilization regulatory protein [Bacillus sp. cl95]